MTTVFLNGGLGSPGEAVQSRTEMLTLIQTFAAQAGWQTVSGSPGAPPLVLRAQEGYGGVFPAYRFSLDGSNPDRILVQGDSSANGGILNPVATAFDITPSAGNSIYGTINEGTICLLVIRPNGTAGSFNLGWLDRFNPNDFWAWNQTRIHNAANSLNLPTGQGFIAKDSAAALNWPNSNTGDNNSQSVAIGLRVAFLRNNFANSGNQGRAILTPWTPWVGDTVNRGFCRFVAGGLIGTLGSAAPVGSIFFDTVNGRDEFYISNGVGQGILFDIK